MADDSYGLRSDVMAPTPPPPVPPWPDLNTTNVSHFLLDDLNNGTGGNNTVLNCNDWLQAQHVLFQLANLCFCVAFLAPSSFRFRLPLMRTVLSLGCLFLVIWGSAVVCLVDILTWYLFFLVINATHLGILLSKLCPTYLHPTKEELYSRTFKPFQVSRYQFKEMTALAQLRQLPAGTAYALEGRTCIGREISILLSGRLKVNYESVFLHYIEPCQFVDSPEYEASFAPANSSDTFQVSISALEDSCLLTWSIEPLQQYLKTKPFLAAIFTNLVGKDITHKLYQVQELLVSRPDDLKVITSRSSSVHVRDSLSQTLSSHNMHLELEGLDGLPSPATTTTTGDTDNAKARIPTPVGPYSPSQVSFETCV